MKRKKQWTLCGISPRAWVAEYLGDNRARFEYPCGYTRVGDVMPPGTSKALAEKFARYWSKENTGVHDECPRCRRAAQKEAREARRRQQ